MTAPDPRFYQPRPAEKGWLDRLAEDVGKLVLAAVLGPLFLLVWTAPVWGIGVVVIGLAYLAVWINGGPLY